MLHWNDKWNERWLQMCDLIASWSHDASTKLGAVIVDDRNVVLAIGWNGFPRRNNDTIASRNERPAKYSWTEHAERNAIYNAASRGIALNDATMYTQSLPCPDCARAIIQSGIKTVIVKNKVLNDRWAEVQAISDEMFKEAGIHVVVLGNLKYGEYCP